MRGVRSALQACTGCATASRLNIEQQPAPSLDTAPSKKSCVKTGLLLFVLGFVVSTVVKEDRR